MTINKPEQKRPSLIRRLIKLLHGAPKDKHALLVQLREAEKRGLFSMDAMRMFEGVMQVSEVQVRDIMIPRSQMVVLDLDASLEEILPIVIESNHSRFPVIGDNRDHIVGILLAKELLKFCHLTTHIPFRIQNLLRPTVIIPESKRLDVLLKEFRQNRNHMAIVVDEYGGVSGLVTIEDVLEQIVGDIEDEYDIEDDTYIRKQDEHKYLIKALTPIEDFNHFFGSAFDHKENDTVGGLIIQEFGHLPRRGEELTIERWHFKVLKADKRRVRALQVTIPESSSDDDEEG